MSIPVVANGDIWSESDYHKCRKVTGCEHVMIGRGLVADPLMAQSIASHSSETHRTKRAKSTLEFLLHYSERALNEHSAKYATARTKQLSKMMGQTHGLALKCFNDIKRMLDITAIHKAIRNIIDTESSDNYSVVELIQPKN